MPPNLSASLIVKSLSSQPELIESWFGPLEIDDTPISPINYYCDPKYWGKFCYKSQDNRIIPCSCCIGDDEMWIFRAEEWLNDNSGKTLLPEILSCCYQEKYDGTGQEIYFESD